MWQKLKKYRVLGTLLGGSFALVVGGWAWASLALRGLSRPLIVSFNDIQGVTGTGAWTHLHGLGGVGLVLVIVNSFLALELERRDRFWGKLVAAATLALSALIFIAFASIISIN